MKSNKIIFGICLSVFAVAIVGAVINSIINYDSVVSTFKTLGYPIYLIQLLGVAQLTGLAIIILNKDQFLVEWVYAGFFMNFILGAIAHLIADSGNGASAVVCLIILMITYVQAKKIRAFKKENTNIESLRFTNSVSA